MTFGRILANVPADAKTDLQVILNALVEGICAIDAEGDATFCNDAFLVMTGFSREELIGKNVHELVHHSHPDGTPFLKDECPMQKTLVSGESIALKTDTLWRKDGAPLPVKYCVHALRQQTDGTKCVVVIEDITEWERSAEALQNSKECIRRKEEKFRRILVNLPDIAWTVEQSGRVTYISPRIEELTGFSCPEIYAGGLGQLFERTHRYDISRLRKAFDDLFARRHSFDVEFRYQRKNGDWIWLHSRSTGAYEEDGTVVADGMICDISARKQAEIELHRKTAFFEAQADSTIDGILVVDASGHRILQNQRMIEIFRVPPELLLTTDDRIELEYVVQRVKNSEAFLAKVEHLYAHWEETSRDEIELLDGTILDRYSAPVMDKWGKYFGRIWNFRDITDHRKAEDRLRQLSVAVEQSSASIIITDPDGKITYVNRKFCESSGYTFAEVFGQNPRFLNSGHSPKEMYETLWATVRGGKEWRGELRNKKKNGEIYWESAAITPIVDEKGSIVHFLAVKEDITERRLLESELRQAQKLEGIGQLAAGIAHEINTPTQFVSDNLTFLQESWGTVFKLIETYRTTVRDRMRNALPEEVAALKAIGQEYDLDFIAEEVPRAIAQSLDGARRVANIVRAMKEFSHPDSAGKTATDINKGIASTITVARNEWKYVAEMITDFDESLPAVICYHGEVNQVILNLIVNAAHAIKEKVKNGEKGKITIRTRRREHCAEFSISDTGMGIPDEIQARIYEPFFTTKEVGKGTGQGLAFAHSVVVKKHQGKIWFETEAGQGTTFIVQLPIEQLDVQEGV